MTDTIKQLEELRSEVPLPDEHTAARVRAHATSTRAPRRLRPTVAVALAALVIAGGAVAAVKESPWWDSGAPAVDPQAVASVARDNEPGQVHVDLARTVAQDGNAALVAAPLDQSGYCLIPALDSKAVFGAQCDFQAVDVTKGVDDQASSVAGHGAWLVYGRITDPRAAKIDLGPMTLDLKPGGFFLAEIAKPQWSAFDMHANRGRILAADGSTLRRGCVNWGPSPNNPRANGTEVTVWSDGDGPCKASAPMVPPTAVLSQAKELVGFTLTSDYATRKAGEHLVLWQAPATNGWTCQLLGTEAEMQNGTLRGFSECSELPQTQTRPGHPFSAVSFGTSHGDELSLLTGYANPASGIVKVALEQPSKTIPLAYGHGWFIGQFSEDGPKLGDVVGYDANGNVVARESLDDIRRMATPH